MEFAVCTDLVPHLRRRRLASWESPEKVEGGCHFLWLLSDDCDYASKSVCSGVCVPVCVCDCVCLCGHVLVCSVYHLPQMLFCKCVFFIERGECIRVLNILRSVHVHVLTWIFMSFAVTSVWRGSWVLMFSSAAAKATCATKSSCTPLKHRLTPTIQLLTVRTRKQTGRRLFHCLSCIQVGTQNTRTHAHPDVNIQIMLGITVYKSYTS